MLNRIFFISPLLGVATLVLHVAASKESLEVRVYVTPPGSHMYLGECVSLQCKVKSCSTWVKSYRWYRSKAHMAPNPRHLVSGDSYFITAVTSEDADGYWCRAECRENQTVFALSARPVALSVSDSPPPSLSLTPNTRQMFRGERFTVRCPASDASPSGWELLHFPSGRGAGTPASSALRSPGGGGVRADEAKGYQFTAATGNSGLYWCNGTGGRSNAVCIAVNDGNISLKSPALPVFPGDDVALYCQYQSGSQNTASFFKNGAEIDASSSSSSDGVVTMTLENVTRANEGLYKCAVREGKMQSPESWLSVRPDRGNFTATEGTPASTSGTWKRIIGSGAVVLLFLIPITAWLVYRYRYQKFCTFRCCPVSGHEVPGETLPETKQDMTEVQWDLTWMEMSNLLDKDSHHAYITAGHESFSVDFGAPSFPVASFDMPQNNVCGSGSF